MPNAEVSVRVELTGANAWLGLRVVWQRVQGLGRRDAHRSAGRVVRCVRESCRGRWQVWGVNAIACTTPTR
jgi:hypothetical protein